MAGRVVEAKPSFGSLNEGLNAASVERNTRVAAKTGATLLVQRPRPGCHGI